MTSQNEDETKAARVSCRRVPEADHFPVRKLNTLVVGQVKIFYCDPYVSQPHEGHKGRWCFNIIDLKGTLIGNHRLELNP